MVRTAMLAAGKYGLQHFVGRKQKVDEKVWDSVKASSNHVVRAAGLDYSEASKLLSKIASSVIIDSESSEDEIADAVEVSTAVETSVTEATDIVDVKYFVEPSANGEINSDRAPCTDHQHDPRMHWGI
jgi:hypothetical protein